MISIALTLAAAFIFILQPRKVQFYIFSLSVFFEFSFGNIRSIPSFLLVEWITPLFFLILVNEIIPLHRIKREKIVDFRGTEIFIFAIILLIISAAVSYGKNEIFNTQNYYISETTGIKRTYYGIINNILIFFTTIIYFSRHFTEFEVGKWVKLIIITSITLGFLRIASFLWGFSIPFMPKGFEYGDTSTQYGGLAYRLGGLGDLTIVGISALFADFYKKQKFNIFYTFSLLLIQFMSGGRTILVGIILAVSLYSTFFLKRVFAYLFIFGSISVIAFILIVPERVIEGQINRMTAFQSGIDREKNSRIAGYYIFFDSFKKDPFFGKGISEYRGMIIIKDEIQRAFVRSLAFAGGHGSYFSVLGIFGITGLLYFLLMVFGGIIISYKKLKYYFQINSSLTVLSTFCFMFFVMESVSYIAGGSGIDVASLFFVVGLISSIKINENLGNII